MQCLTQLDVQGDDFLLEINGFIAEANMTAESKTLAEHLTRTAWTNRNTCDQFIADTVKHWQLQRIALIDRAILRLAIAELLYRPEVPVKVVLDQAIELAKKFSTAESPQFINGVLDAIAKKVQPAATEKISSEAAEPSAAEQPADTASPTPHEPETEPSSSGPDPFEPTDKE
jgi:transcription antitermination factor NusB